MKKSFVFLLVVISFARLASAQPPSTIYSVREDVVKPSMESKYRETMKKLKAACEQNKINFSWGTVAFDDCSYRHLVPISGFSELEKNPFAALEEKLGKEAFAKIWTELGECVESQNTFVMKLLPQFSYLSPAAGENYRDIMYWYPLPGKEAEAESILAEWKRLCESKKTDGYLVYKVIFGREPVYSFVSFGKDGVDVDEGAKRTAELLGEELGKLWLKTQAITKRYYTKRGSVQPELSYSAPK